MSEVFCTDCGRPVSASARYCEFCGHPLDPLAVPGQSAGQNTVPQAPPPPETSVSPGLPVDEARKVISNWVTPFNATIVFGTSVVGAMDFLSPRVALLPLAATAAVVGLIGCLLLRRYIAPKLPVTSKLRSALAPESRMHRSPLMIVTVVLSALMVSGAAWSSAEASRGGILAGKFDAARHAQLQLGVLQSVQKEQRVQTAVMEDIREGRAANPRRELSNQGILWTDAAFSSAVSNRDLAVVSLFLAGGMRWYARDAKVALAAPSDELLQLLLNYPDRLENTRGCMDAYNAVVHPQLVVLRSKLTREPQPVPRLSALHLKMVKTFCPKSSDMRDTTTDWKAMKDSKEYRSMFSQANRLLAPTPGTIRTPSQCRSDLLAGNGRVIRQALPSYEVTQGREVIVGDNPLIGFGREDTRIKRYEFPPGEMLLNRAKTSGTFTLDARAEADIAAFCDTPDALKSEDDDFDAQMFKQVNATLY